MQKAEKEIPTHTHTETSTQHESRTARQPPLAQGKEEDSQAKRRARSTSCCR